MSSELPDHGILKRRRRAGWRAGVLLVVVKILLLTGVVSAEFDSHGWKFVRKVHVPSNLSQGMVAIPLESSVIEACRGDLGDLRAVDSNDEVIPLTVEQGEFRSEPAALPVNIYRVASKPGKWTDIWMDKSAKALSNAIVLQTSSKNFLRKVEIRGSDNGRDSFVIRMDGLIADRAGPVSVRSVKIDHPANNFQYIHLRILDDGQQALKIESAKCLQPLGEDSAHSHVELRIIENRSVSDNNSTVVVADLGEKRYPLSSLSISTSAKNFAKRGVLRCASSASSESWNKFYEGAFFRLRKDEAFVESLEARFKPQTSRFLMVEISGPDSPAVAVDSLEATATIPFIVLEYRKGRDYSVYYGNPQAKASPGARSAPPQAVQAAISMSSEIRLGKEEKNLASPRQERGEHTQETRGRYDFWRPAGIAMLLSSLLLLFGLMLRSRRRRKDRLYRSPKTFGS